MSLEDVAGQPITSFGEVHPLAGSAIMYSKDAGEHWTPALMFPERQHPSDPGYRAARAVEEGGVPGYMAITPAEFERGLMVRPAKPEEVEGVQFSYGFTPEQVEHWPLD